MDPATIATILNAVATVGGPLISSLTGGTGRRTGFLPEQEDFLQQLLQGLQTGQGPLGAPFDINRFQREVGDPIRQQFQQLTVPQIQQRFAGQGQLRGTAAGDTITRAGADLEGQLAQGAFQAEQSALDRILRGAQLGLQQPGLETFRPDSPISDIAGGIGRGAAQDFNLQDFLRVFTGGTDQRQGTRPPVRSTAIPAIPPRQPVRV